MQISQQSRIVPDPTYFGNLSSFQSIATTEGDNLTSTRNTIERMKEISVRSSVHPVVLSAFDLIRQRMLSQYPDAIGVFNGIYGYVKRVVRFEDDDKVVCSYIDPGANAELLITPERLLTMPEPKGDCDDFSMLLASLVIASQEICKVYFVTVAADHNAPDEFSHVYVAVQLPSQQTFVMDGSHGPWFGWEVQNVFKKRYWEVFER